MYFERAGFSAEVTHDGESGLALARNLAPDLIVLDLMLPRLNGVDLCRILRRESEVPIIMLTAREAHAERIIGLDSGADDYIVKPFDPEEVIARAEAVLRRVKGRVQQVLALGNITLNETTLSVTVNGEPVDLSQAQIALLSTFMRHPNQVLTRDQLISLTFDNQFDGFDRAIDSQVARLRKQISRDGGPAHSDRLRRWLQVRGGGRMMSLRRRIMGSMVAVIVLTVLISVGVGYYTTQYRLGVFVDEIGDDEAIQLARNLSREYTAAGGWETVERPMSEAGYIYDGVLQRERHEESEGESFELFRQDPIRVIIVGVDGRVVKDNLSELLPGTAAPDLDGHRETVFNLTTDQPVGHVYVDVNHDLLSAESHGFLNRLLYITVIGGMLTVCVAMLLAAWLSKRITAPVTALTEATQAIAQGDTTQLPVASSDELGRMSAAFNRMTSTLETQRELRRRLINDVSHELNTPLTVIQLEAKGLRDGLQTSESASDHIVQEVDRLRGLVTDLEWLAETDSGELRLTLEESSIYELLTPELDRWQTQSQARTGRIVAGGIPRPPGHGTSDRMRMSQALGNVLSNAIHCTEAGGSVLLRAGLESDETLAISITDDGIGIDAADLPHVFGRFYRTDQSRSHGIGGTGLGLAIARSIVEAHGGTITVASNGLGQGVAVTLRLPVNK